MRLLLVLLLAANLAVLGWWQGWLPGWSARHATPVEVHPERLRVVPIERLGRTAPAPRQRQQFARIRSSSDVVERSKRNGIE